MCCFLWMDSLYNVQGYDGILVRILYSICIMQYACLKSIGDYQHIRHIIYQSTLFVQDNVLSFDEINVMVFCRSSNFTTDVQRRIVGWECRRRGLLLQPGFLILLYFPAVGSWLLVVGWWFRLSVITVGSTVVVCYFLWGVGYQMLTADLRMSVVVAGGS